MIDSLQHTPNEPKIQEDRYISVTCLAGHLATLICVYKFWPNVTRPECEYVTRWRWGDMICAHPLHKYKAVYLTENRHTFW